MKKLTLTSAALIAAMLSGCSDDLGLGGGDEDCSRQMATYRQNNGSPDDVVSFSDGMGRFSEIWQYFGHSRTFLWGRGSGGCVEQQLNFKVYGIDDNRMPPQ